MHIESLCEEKPLKILKIYPLPIIEKVHFNLPKVFFWRNIWKNSFKVKGTFSRDGFGCLLYVWFVLGLTRGLGHFLFTPMI
jgi:hypothetical protein